MGKNHRKITPENKHKQNIFSLSKMEDTLYDTLGGEPTFTILVDRFYEGCLTDKLVKHFFHAELVKYLRGQLQAYLAHVFGKRQYNGKSMRAAHAHLKIKPKHFDRILKILETTLRKLLQEKLGTNGTKDQIENIVESVIDIAETTRSDILGILDPAEGNNSDEGEQRSDD